MDCTNKGTPRVWVLVGHFGDHLCSRFAEDPEGQGEGVKCLRPVHFSWRTSCPGTRAKLAASPCLLACEIPSPHATLFGPRGQEGMRKLLFQSYPW